MARQKDFPYLTESQAYEWALNLSKAQGKDEVRIWLSKLKDKKRAAFHLYRYCRWARKTPKELLALKKRNKDNGAERLLDSFVASAEFTPSVLNMIVAHVKSFYMWNYADLARRSGKVQYAHKKPYRTPTQESLRRFYEQARNWRDRAVIVWAASTFQRESTIAKMNWGHVLPTLNDDIPYIRVQSTELKGGGVGRYSNIEQHCFLTPEAKEVLLQYKRFLEKRGVQITEDTPLFLHITSAVSAKDKKGKQTGTRKYTRISGHDVTRIFLRTSRNGDVHLSPHDLRRYGQTQLEEAHLPPNWIKKFLGHKVSGEEDPYSRPKIRQLKEAFKQALPHIIFLKRELTKTEAHDEEIAKLKQQLEELNERLEFSESIAESYKEMMEGDWSWERKSMFKICELTFGLNRRQTAKYYKEFDEEAREWKMRNIYDRMPDECAGMSEKEFRKWWIQMHEESERRYRGLHNFILWLKNKKGLSIKAK
jgi:uncharacterized protein YukE